MSLRFYPALLIILLSASAFSKEIFELKKVAYSLPWLKLLHYDKSSSGKYLSRADGRNFFLSPLGKENPEEELKASLSNLNLEIENNIGDKIPFQCAMPARTDFLIKTFHLKLPAVSCPSLNSFLKLLNPHGVSLVFASSFANSSASYFGHTFLRFHSRPGKESNGLLDYTLSYSAGVPADTSLLSLAINGVSGGFKAAMEIMPYYKKIDEYNHMEQRDLWSYEIDLTEEETIFLAKHIWELNLNTDFDYYFLDENCAYFLLAILEAAKPHWDMLEQFFIYVTPVESIKALKQVGAIKNTSMRPSLRSELLRFENSLDENEILSYQNIITGKKNVSEEKNILVLEAVLAYFSYKKFDKNSKLKKEDIIIYENVIKQRSLLPLSKNQEMKPIDLHSRPDLSHHTFMWGGAVGYSKRSVLPNSDGHFTEFIFKPAVHDLLNKDLGFNPNSQTDYFKFSFRYYVQSKKVDLDEFLLVGITTLLPRSNTEHPLSWGLHAGVTTLKDICFKCKAAFMDFESGLSWSYAQNRLNFYLLPLAYLQASSSFHHFLRTGPGVNFGLIGNPFLNYKIQLQNKFKLDLFKSYIESVFFTFEVNQSYSVSQKIDLRIYLSHWQQFHAVNGKYQEVKLNFNYYF